MSNIMYNLLILLILSQFLELSYKAPSSHVVLCIKAWVKIVSCFSWFRKHIDVELFMVLELFINPLIF